MNFAVTPAAAAKMAPLGCRRRIDGAGSNAWARFVGAREAGGIERVGLAVILGELGLAMISHIALAAPRSRDEWRGARHGRCDTGAGTLAQAQITNSSLPIIARRSDLNDQSQTSVAGRPLMQTHFLRDGDAVRDGISRSR